MPIISIKRKHDWQTEKAQTWKQGIIWQKKVQVSNNGHCTINTSHNSLDSHGAIHNTIKHSAITGQVKTHQTATLKMENRKAHTNPKGPTKNLIGIYLMSAIQLQENRPHRLPYKKILIKILDLQFTSTVQIHKNETHCKLCQPHKVIQRAKTHLRKMFQQWQIMVPPHIHSYRWWFSLTWKMKGAQDSNCRGLRML